MQTLQTTADGRRTVRFLRHLSTLGVLTTTAIWGTLTREGLVSLNTYDGASVAPLVWVQATGCLIMGLASGANRRIIESWYPPAYIMLTTGFCGSTTTFSGWILDVFQAFANLKHYDRRGLHNIMDAATQTLVTLGISSVSMATGVALSDGFLRVDAWFPTRSGSVLTEPASTPQHGSQSAATYVGAYRQRHDMWYLDVAMILLGLSHWLGAGVICWLHAEYRSIAFGLVLGPPGTILRWYLACLNSSAISQRWKMPLGTLVANVVAVSISAAAYIAMTVVGTTSTPASNRSTCEVLKGVQDGFCGCLSTLSAMIVEMRSVRPRRLAARYVAVSWLIGILLCVLLIGVPWWAKGMSGHCSTGRV